MQKITFGEMCEAGVRQVFISCADYRCSHYNVVADDRDHWPDEPRLSDVEDKFVCISCGQRAADVRPDWSSAQRETASPARS